MSPPAAVSAPRDRLRIAIQKNGRLGDPARALLGSCGLSWSESPDRLFCYGQSRQSICCWCATTISPA